MDSQAAAQENSQEEEDNLTPQEEQAVSKNLASLARVAKTPRTTKVAVATTVDSKRMDRASLIKTEISSRVARVTRIKR